MAISFPNSEELIDYIRSQTDTVFLSWSNGKDCLAAYLAIRDKFPAIIPFHLYLIPDLEFVEQSLTYYESIFGCRIHRLPHPSLYRWLRNHTFQAPENWAIVEHSSLQNFTYDACVQYLIEDYGYPKTAWTATGVRAIDSPTRLASIRKHGAYNEKRQTFFPVWDWRKQRLIDEITASGIKLPVDYHLFGRSFDGIDRRFIEPIKKHFPRDYERIKEFFPLIDADLWRATYGRSKRTNAAAPTGQTKPGNKRISG